MAANVTPVEAFTVEDKFITRHAQWKCMMLTEADHLNKHGVQPGIFKVVTILEGN